MLSKLPLLPQGHAIPVYQSFCFAASAAAKSTLDVSQPGAEPVSRLTTLTAFWKSLSASLGYPCMISVIATMVRHFQQFPIWLLSPSKMRTWEGVNVLACRGS
jgi:hypothetical protein